jgi:selenocysteine-specific translation elongation factor
LDGFITGVFGSSTALKASFLNSIAKKSEVEGLIVYHKTEAGKRFSFLDDSTFSDKIQGYARIASLSDYAYYIYPNGELAVLVDSQKLDGSIITVDSAGIGPEMIQTSFKGLSLSKFPIDERDSKSSIIDLTKIKPKSSSPKSGTLVYIDRAFNVKGVGLVVLGFILSGKVALHDKLRPIPGNSERIAEVKGIQVSDEDQQSAGRGIRVGLSLKGIELKDLARTSWLDDGSFSIVNKVSFEFEQSPYYRQPVIERDMHLECAGELLVSRIARGTSQNQLVATLASEVPVWSEMRLNLIDLNGKLLRIAGGGTFVS